MKVKMIKSILLAIGIICIVGLSWVNLWFALLGFILISGVMCYKLFAYGMSYGEHQDKTLEKEDK